MVVHISGTRDGADWPAVGGVVTVGEVEAADLISAGFAVPAKVEPERAVARKAETRKGSAA